MSHAFIKAGWLMNGSGGPVRENVLLSLHKETITQIEEARPKNWRYPEPRMICRAALTGQHPCIYWVRNIQKRLEPTRPSNSSFNSLEVKKTDGHDSTKV